MPVINKTFLDSASQRGASVMETLLSIAIVATILPFAYFRIAEINREITDISVAKRVIDYKKPLLNFVRLNSIDWADESQIKLTKEDIDFINSEMGGSMSTKAVPHIGFIDKYKIRNTTNVDVYLSFNIPGADQLRNAKIANIIGEDAGIVGPDGIAYGTFNNWGAASEDFKPGDLIYRASVNMDELGTEKYLHKVESEKGLNTMARDLFMSGFDVFDAGGVVAKSAEMSDAFVNFVDTGEITTREIFFEAGANLNPTNTEIDYLRVSGDVVGFKNINAKNFTGGGSQWSSQGAIISNSTTIKKSVNVGKNLFVKSSDGGTVSGFTVVSAHIVNVPFVSTTDLNFAPGYGITVSSELLFSTYDSPLQLGRWIFPSDVPAPRFDSIMLENVMAGNMADVLSVSNTEFEKIISSGWKDIRRKAQ